jgi:hypothetical protein
VRQTGVPVDRWTYIAGTSRRRLPALLSRLGWIDLFIHDSMHSNRNVVFELECAWQVCPPAASSWSMISTSIPPSIRSPGPSGTSVVRLHCRAVSAGYAAVQPEWPVRYHLQAIPAGRRPRVTARPQPEETGSACRHSPAQAPVPPRADQQAPRRRRWSALPLTYSHARHRHVRALRQRQ